MANSCISATRDILKLIDCSPLRSISITETSSLLWVRLTSHSSLLLRLMRPPVRPPRIRCTLFPSTYPPHLRCSYERVVIRLHCFWPAYLSEPRLICDFCPSDQRFACSFFQISPRDEHPCCSAIHFPLSGRARDLHPLERAHGAQTKYRAPGINPGRPLNHFY